MKYWWVNQNQTFKHEFSGGYIWSPQRQANGNKSYFYENMKRVSPGEILFSFKDGKIPTIGVIKSKCYESERPVEFGKAGKVWSNIGWKVDVDYNEL